MTFDEIKQAIDDFTREEAEYRSKILIKACEENDFIVPSVEVRDQLEKVLPDANIIVCPYCDSVLMVKKVALEIPFEIGDKE